MPVAFTGRNIIQIQLNRFLFFFREQLRLRAFQGFYWFHVECFKCAIYSKMTQQSLMSPSALICFFTTESPSTAPSLLSRRSVWICVERQVSAFHVYAAVCFDTPLNIQPYRDGQWVLIEVTCSCASTPLIRLIFGLQMLKGLDALNPKRCFFGCL